MRTATTAAMGMVLGLMAAATLGPTALAQDPVKQRLDQSPRHHEWIAVRQGDRSVGCFVVFPEIKEKAPAVIVIHENKGLTDWVRGVADQLAGHGYLAVAPDLLSGMGPRGGDTGEFESADAATRALYAIKAGQVAADLAAVADRAIELPACNGKLAVAGFCWGGSESFKFAAQRPDLKAAFVFYGSAAHTKDEFARIACPVYGFYGESDARVNATLPATATAMKEAGKVFEPVTYEGAGHGFMRSGEDPAGTEANRKARDAAWKRLLDLLKKL